jgi:hypothetical protein
MTAKTDQPELTAKTLVIALLPMVAMAIAILAALFLWSASHQRIVVGEAIARNAFAFLFVGGVASVLPLLLPQATWGNFWLRAINKLAVVCVCFGYANFCYLALRCLNYATMAYSTGWADVTVQQWDIALGFDWNAYAAFFTQHPNVAQLAELAYSKIELPMIAIILLLGIEAKYIDLRDFIYSTMLCALMVSMVSMLYPLRGAVDAYATTDLAAQLEIQKETYHIATIDALRTAPQFVFLPEALPGLSAFPSFHTSLGLLLVWATRNKWYLMLPALAYSTLMIAATPIYGAHYFADLIAGAVMTVAVLLFWHRVAAPSFENRQWAVAPAIAA